MPQLPLSQCYHHSELPRVGLHHNTTLPLLSSFTQQSDLNLSTRGSFMSKGMSASPIVYTDCLLFFSTFVSETFHVYRARAVSASCIAEWRKASSADPVTHMSDSCSSPSRRPGPQLQNFVMRWLRSSDDTEILEASSTSIWNIGFFAVKSSEWTGLFNFIPLDLYGLHTSLCKGWKDSMAASRYLSPCFHQDEY